jgi:hypothetical protein
LLLSRSRSWASATVIRGFAGHTRWNPGKARFDKGEEEDAAAEKRKRLPQLKHTLRKFYLKVHPDLFGNYPKEKETNEAL